MMRIDECELYVVFRSVVAPFLLDVIHSKHDAASKSNKVSPPGAARRYAPPQMAVRRWQKSRRIYVRPRTCPQSAHLWWPAVADLQAASVPIAEAAAPWDRQTDGHAYGWIALCQNGRGIIISSTDSIFLPYAYNSTTVPLQVTTEL